MFVSFMCRVSQQINALCSINKQRIRENRLIIYNAFLSAILFIGMESGTFAAIEECMNYKKII